ncbi:MAG TPA: hypothetical protein ENI64_00650 [Gammaproteobacteria bacterium]|nr:hypothetical protein [Gammaproteobacteria bacterium]
MKLSKKLLSVAIAAAIAAPVMVTPVTAQAGGDSFTGNIGIHSKYLLRGIFEETNDPAVQGGLDYSKDNGFYAGWWFSNLGYSYDSSRVGVPVSGGGVEDGIDFGTARGFENDFYAGFAGDFGDSGVGWDVSLLQYLYLNVDDANLTEALGTLSYKGFSVGFQYLLVDGWWGNAGDIYWKAGYETDLPKNFSLALGLTWYTYDDSDNSELGGCGGTSVGCNVTTNDSGFRYFNITVSHPIGSTGADAYVQYTFAGEDRTGKDYDDSIVAGITYDFDI